jgi:hypothetical protein
VGGRTSGVNSGEGATPGAAGGAERVVATPGVDSGEGAATGAAAGTDALRLSLVIVPGTR